MPAGNSYKVLDSRDIVADFYPRLEAAMESIWAPRVAVEVPSDRETEEYTWLGQVPAMRKWVGGRAEEFVNKYTLSIQNFNYESTLPISVDDLRRDKTGQLRQRVADLATRTATHWNQLLATLITNGEAGTSGLAYDGQFFFDTDHAESGANQTNDLTATEVPSANVTTPGAPTSTEAANIITETVGYMQSLTDDKGQPINQGPSNVIIFVTKAPQYAAFKNAIALNNLSTGSDNNPVRGFANDGWTFEVQYVTRITAADKIYFFLGNPAMGTTPLIRQSEVDVTTSLIGAGSEEEFKFNRHIFGVSAVRGVGYGMWQKAAIVALS